MPDTCYGSILTHLRLQLARVSSRLHDLSLDSALWRKLGLGPSIGSDMDMPTDRACNLLRTAPELTALRIHDRQDADAILLEVRPPTERRQPATQAITVGARSLRTGVFSTANVMISLEPSRIREFSAANFPRFHELGTFDTGCFPSKESE